MPNIWFTADTHTIPGVGRQMDVGVDTNNFYPWAWEDIVKKLSDLPYYPDESEK